jgi:phage terminase small subunit
LAKKPASARKRPTAAIAEAKVKAKHQAFVEHYLDTWNATTAAKRAGYSAKSAYAQGSRLLRNAEVHKLIEERLADLAMGPKEVLARLSAMASSSLEDFLNDKGQIDLKKARTSGRMHLVKKYTVDPLGKKTLELHDPQAALVQLGRHYKLFVERHEHTGQDGGPIEFADAKAKLLSRFAQSDEAGRADGVPGESDR